MDPVENQTSEAAPVEETVAPEATPEATPEAAPEATDTTGPVLNKPAPFSITVTFNSTELTEEQKTEAEAFIQSVVAEVNTEPYAMPECINVVTVTRL